MNPAQGNIFGRRSAVPVYFSTAQSYTATCPEGTTGNAVTSTAAAGAFYSEVSQEDADAQALAAVTALAEATIVCEAVPEE